MDSQTTSIQMAMSLYSNVLLILTLFVAGLFIPYNPYKRTTLTSLLVAHAILWLIIQDDYLAKCISGRVGYFIGFLHAVDGRRIQCSLRPGGINNFAQFPPELWVLEQLCQGQLDGFDIRPLGTRAALTTLSKTCIYGIPASLPFFCLAIWLRFVVNLVLATIDDLQFEQYQTKEIVKIPTEPVLAQELEGARVAEMEQEIEDLKEEVKLLVLQVKMEKERTAELTERLQKVELAREERNEREKAEQEEREKAEQEKKDKAESEMREKVEQEKKDIAEREEREKAEQEKKSKEEREERETVEQDGRDKAEKDEEEQEKKEGREEIKEEDLEDETDENSAEGKETKKKKSRRSTRGRKDKKHRIATEAAAGNLDAAEEEDGEDKDEE
ncbi:hypothetical protein BP5796_03724 [Coleophoma crateriformis]|uniref:Uncharacterized protein n=1 Tax=Coleophoma crateriformis TaxID=565419 RepID=A0A3D8SGC2_9HELO|nr:hypothetical protein BP5796_03724 [Coleophoma crateriformis]